MTNKKTISERELVLGILLEVTRDGTYSHVALRNVLGKYQYLDKKERAFITRVVEGTLEHMLEIDYIINQFSNIKVNKMKPVIRTIIRSAVYQLKYMDSVPNSAVCNEAVKLAVKKGFGNLKGFVNGVLRNIERNLSQITYPDRTDVVPFLSIQYSMPEWIVKKWLHTYNQATVEDMLCDFQKEKPTTIRVNLEQTSTDKLKRNLEQLGIKVDNHPYLDYALCISDYNYLGELESFQKGEFQVQDISSMLVTEIAEPKEGDCVMDVCASPGGKSLHMAERLKGSGLVEARDLTDYKIQLLEENILRSGKQNITAKKQDATILDITSKEKADIVLADLPCSGLGVLGKKTDLKYKITENMMKSLVELQRQILSIVSSYVKPGGILIYSTCTINEEENLNNVHWFLKHYPFELVNIKEVLPNELCEQVIEEGCLQLLPGINQSDGFFLAKLRRVNEGY
ncbi:MAG: 16S rRNA (cytosine(967)-C(5))-methyltransferase RsmB [Lachnospiraceae bacterium]